ncbi:MAG: hypothetical protein ACLUUO_00280 [Sellimonas intestinalis]
MRDGRGIAAAFMLGARGSTDGNPFRCYQRISWYMTITKKRIIKAKDIDSTCYRKNHMDIRYAALRNQMTREYIRIRAGRSIL